jgi:hypothetical protein
MKGLVHRILRRMVIGLTILLICLLSAKTHPSTDEPETYVSRSEYSNLLFAQQMGDSVRLGSADSIKLKDPKMAVFYAIIPGLVVHGAGHFYAGEKTTGWILVAGETLSLAMLTYCIGVGIGQSTDGATSNGSSELVGIVGATLFMGTWIYDIIGAPLSVIKENREPSKHKNLKVGVLGRDGNSHYVGIVLIKRF